MTLCLAKKDSIKSATTRLFLLIRAWKQAKKIDELDFNTAIAQLEKIEGCTNLEKSYDMGG